MASVLQQSLYWTNVAYEDWNMYMAATANGVCYVSAVNEPFDKLVEWVSRRLPNHLLIQDADMLKHEADELVDYLRGNRTSFTSSCDLQGTTFQLAVWNELLSIPYGQTKSYSEIASAIDKPAAVRAVGSAIGANPVLITVPCHRVIGKNGALTGYRGGMDMKRKLLALEQTKL